MGLAAVAAGAATAGLAGVATTGAAGAITAGLAGVAGAAVCAMAAEPTKAANAATAKRGTSFMVATFSYGTQNGAVSKMSLSRAVSQTENGFMRFNKTVAHLH